MYEAILLANRGVDEVVRGLERLKRAKDSKLDSSCFVFDNFDAMVEDDASWAHKFKREYNQKTKDPDDIYFDIKDSEERRKKKGLPPRVVILPGWDVSDEERYDERQAVKKKRTATKKKTAAKRHKTGSAGKKRPQTVAAQRAEGEAKR